MSYCWGVLEPGLGLGVVVGPEVGLPGVGLLPGVEVLLPGRPLPPALPPLTVCMSEIGS
jgi:hypothetical protein